MIQRSCVLLVHRGEAFSYSPSSGGELPQRVLIGYRGSSRIRIRIIFLNGVTVLQVGSLVKEAEQRNRASRCGRMPQFKFQIFSPGQKKQKGSKFTQRIRTPSPTVGRRSPSSAGGGSRGSLSAGISFSRPPPVAMQLSSSSVLSRSESSESLGGAGSGSGSNWVDRLRG